MTSEEDRQDLARRLGKLEAIEAIRALKARYLNACDTKRPEEVRACFADGPMTIDVGHLGVFHDADSFVAMYAQAACHDHVYDKHQCGNAEIEIVDDRNATARWCLDFRSINAQKMTLTMMSTFYHDVYVRTPAGWKISASRTEFKSLFTCRFAGGEMAALFAGRSFAEADFMHLLGADAPLFAGSAGGQP